MRQELELLFLNDDILFNATKAHGRCLPHIIHLAAIKVGELSIDSSIVWMMFIASGWYWWPHSVWLKGWRSTQLPRVGHIIHLLQWRWKCRCLWGWCWSHNVEGHSIHWCIWKGKVVVVSSSIMIAIVNAFKLRRIICSIRSSPQHRQQWFEEIEMSRRDVVGELKETLKILILDVRTRWSSAYQMCSMFFFFIYPVW